MSMIHCMEATLAPMIRYNMEGAPGVYDSIQYIDKSHPLSSCDVILIRAPESYSDIRVHHASGHARQTSVICQPGVSTSAKTRHGFV